MQQKRHCRKLCVFVYWSSRARWDTRLCQRFLEQLKIYTQNVAYGIQFDLELRTWWRVCIYVSRAIFDVRSHSSRIHFSYTIWAYLDDVIWYGSWDEYIVTRTNDVANRLSLSSFHWIVYSFIATLVHWRSAHTHWKPKNSINNWISWS